MYSSHSSKRKRYCKYLPKNLVSKYINNDLSSKDKHQPFHSARGPTCPFHAFDIPIPIPFNLLGGLYSPMFSYPIISRGENGPNRASRLLTHAKIDICVAYTRLILYLCVTEVVRNCVRVRVCFIYFKPLSTTRQNNISLTSVCISVECCKL